MNSTYSAFLLLFVGAACLSAVVGVLVAGVRDAARRLLPASGLLLIAVALAGVLPELTGMMGWPAAVLAFCAALACVWVFDRFVHPVCPACSHSHDHAGCVTRLHGFAGPLLVAMAVHNVFDGWMLSMADAQIAGHALSIGVIAHKIPECFAFGAILAAALRSRFVALWSAVLTQLVTGIGVGLHWAVSPVVGPLWIGALLALGGGVFFYLGVHAVHGEWKRRSAGHAIHIS